MLTQEQLDKINSMATEEDETRYPYMYITLKDLAEILGLELKCSGRNYDTPDTLSFLPSENSEKKT